MSSSSVAVVSAAAAAASASSSDGKCFMCNNMKANAKCPNKACAPCCRQAKSSGSGSGETCTISAHRMTSGGGSDDESSTTRDRTSTLEVKAISERLTKLETNVAACRG